MEEVERRINKLNKSYSIPEHIRKLEEEFKMLSTSVGYGTPEQENPRYHDAGKIVLKGQGRYNDVLKEIKEILGPDIEDRFAREVLTYLEPYLKGKITREEFTYSVGSWFIGNNLKTTQLMDTINDKGKEWRKLMDDPRLWYEQYWKITDKKTGKIHIEPAFDHQVPRNITQAEVNPHAVDSSSISAGPVQAIRQLPPSLKKIIDNPNPIKEYDECDDAGCGKVEMTETTNPLDMKGNL